MAYYEQRTLNRHIRLAHSTAQRKRFRCPNTLCDKSYSSIAAFRTHACIDGRRPQNLLKINCELCQKRFFNKFELTRHVKRAHSYRAENFTCDGCGKTFLHRFWDSYVQVMT